MPEINILLAFFSGLLTFFSSCLIPIVPVYVGYISGVGIRNINGLENESHDKAKKNILLNSLSFVLGFSIIFILLGLTASALGSLLEEKKIYLQGFSGFFMIIFGLFTLGFFKIPFLYKEFRLKPVIIKSNLLAGSFVMGSIFGLAWTPCISPILSSILFLSSLSSTVWQGGILLVFFSLGLGIPFLVISYGISQGVKILPRNTRYTLVYRFLLGLLLIIVGVLLIFGKWDAVTLYFSRLFS